ncbi:hypothetical protein CKC_01260 [Candidatus Liberibacter solanacearum CLso-ZC1]|uniref:Uncharacterized protein n=1 Tax=Liberibacter solanacearum (strain CLso-ZC1) TaxID=658172 RepID=E4UCB3_LIBSC|nr:hypothetical protein [Candidatus Liberibacter solanacearum]ADR52003.1 hypothetical protein CKC_01260 [Candidatus Liberibacter solanacearum CLso-ZC1]
MPLRCWYPALHAFEHLNPEKIRNSKARRDCDPNLLNWKDSSFVHALKPSLLYLGFSIPLHGLISRYSCLHAHLKKPSWKQGTGQHSLVYLYGLQNVL